MLPPVSFPYANRLSVSEW